MRNKIISVIVGIVLLSSVVSFSPIPVGATDEYDKEFDFSADYQKDSDNDGWADDVDECPYEAALSYGSFRGCPPDGTESSLSGKDLESRSSDDSDDFDLSSDFDDFDEIINDVTDIPLDFADEIFKIIDDIIDSIAQLFR